MTTVIGKIRRNNVQQNLIERREVGQAMKQQENVSCYRLKTSCLPSLKKLLREYLFPFENSFSSGSKSYSAPGMATGTYSS